jgi:hypothetical protein
MTLSPERVLLEEDGITVTTSRLQASGKTYPGLAIPISSVASVYEFGYTPSVRLRAAFQAWAFALYLAAAYLALTHQAESLPGWLVLVASLLFLASRPGSPAWKALASRRLVVELRDNSGEVHALKVSNFGVGQRVYEALRTAVLER